VLPAFAMLVVPAALVNRGRATAIAGRSL
jgi:hypothetical protein